MIFRTIHASIGRPVLQMEPLWMIVSEDCTSRSGGNQETQTMVICTGSYYNIIAQYNNIINL